MKKRVELAALTVSQGKNKSHSLNFEKQITFL